MSEMVCEPLLLRCRLTSAIPTSFAGLVLRWVTVNNAIAIPVFDFLTVPLPLNFFFNLNLN